MLKKLNYIKSQLDLLVKDNLLNHPKTLKSPNDAIIKIGGKTLLNFCSNNYLGLANDKRLKESAKDAIDNYGVGPGAVRTIAGTNNLHLQLEKKLAEFKNVEDVITFQSGFCANLAVIPAIVGESDLIFSDELNHASIIDACRLSKAEVVRYSHLDSKDLETKINDCKLKKGCNKLIVTDGVFSMDGDIAPLPELSNIARKSNAILMVDDAHGEGVLGENGRGVVNHFGLQEDIDIETGTMSKAFGVVGGYVAGRKLIIDWLRQRARPYLFSSAMTSPDTAACITAVEILQHSPDRVIKLWDNTRYFQTKVKDLGFDIGTTKTPITPIMLGETKLAKEVSARLFELGVFATAIGFPTVPQGKARIRVMISAAHSKNNLDKALEAFEKTGKEFNILK